MGDVAEEDRQLGDDAASVDVADRLVGLKDLALSLQPGHEFEQIGPVEFGQADHVGSLFGQPDSEAAQGSSGGGHGFWSQHQCSFCEEAVHDGVDSWLCAPGPGFFDGLAVRQLAGDSSVKQCDARPIGVRSPRTLQDRKPIGIQNGVDAGDLVEGPDRLAQRFDIVGGDRVQIGFTAPQNQPHDRPRDLEFAISTNSEIGDLRAQFVDLLSEWEPERIGDPPWSEHSNPEQPAPVQLQATGEGEIKQIVAGVVVDPAVGDVVAESGVPAPGLAFAVAPTQTLPQRLVEPVGQIREPAHESSVPLQHSRLVVGAAVTGRDEFDELLARAMAGSSARGWCR